MLQVAHLLSKCPNHEEDFFQIVCASQSVLTLVKHSRAFKHAAKISPECFTILVKAIQELRFPLIT